MTRSRSMHTAAIGAALVVLTMIALGGVVGNGFVAYDDGVYVAANEHVLSGITSASIAWAFLGLDAVFEGQDPSARVGLERGRAHSGHEESRGKTHRRWCTRPRTG